jgi:O-antigen/teichoic acid export membrane protein
MLGILGGGLDIILTQKLSVHYAKKDFKNLYSELNAGLLLTSIICIIVFLIGIAMISFVPEFIKANKIDYKAIRETFFFALVGFIFQLLFL